MSLDSQVAALLRDQIIRIISGTIFLSFGLAACAIVAIRRRSGARLVIWLGIWSAMFGANELLSLRAITAVLPPLLQAAPPYLTTAIGYLLVVVGSLAFLELAIGALRIFLKGVILAGLAIAVAGFAIFMATGSEDRLTPPNNLLAACSLLVLTTVVAVPRLSRKFMVLPNRGVLAAGTLVFSIEALMANVAHPLHLPTLHILDSLGFAAFLVSLLYVAVQRIFASEHRLLAIESELEIARQLQFSILPTSIPEVSNMRIAASYLPMTAVAGDFYEFLPVDQHRAGFLIADVSGHGVPAALIASMIKVAAQSVTAWANDPAEVLRRLGTILSGQLRGQFVSAAYLWVDTESCQARYSAAGHPPLLCWRAADGALTRIESNGLLFGVRTDADYPVRDIPLGPGDRFLLYTDGVVEPENASGESFGDRRLEQIMREDRSRPASELSERLLAGVRAWQPASMTQQDDITLVVIDVL